MIDAALIASVCGLTAAISWGVADFLAARASKDVSPELTAVLIGIISAVAFSLFYMFYPGASEWTAHGIAFAAGAGVLMGIGILLFYRGLDVGPVSIVSPVGSAYPLITTFIALSLFHRSLSLFQIIGIILVVAGIMAASEIFSAKKSERRLTQGVMYALGTFLAWGIAFALLGEAVAGIGWQKATIIELWFDLMGTLIILPFLKSRHVFSRSSFKMLSNKYILCAAFIQLFGMVIFSIGLTKSSSSAVITAISASYPALTIFLALKHFGEKVTLVPMAGAAVTLIGVIILSIQ